MKERAIYFARPTGELGPIKIGITTNLPGRLKSMNVDSPVPVEIVATAKGTYADEAQLNRQFAGSHLRGSWFSPDDDLIEFIAQVRAAASLSGIIDWSAKAEHPKCAIARRAWAKRRPDIFGPAPTEAAE